MCGADFGAENGPKQNGVQREADFQQPQQAKVLIPDDHSDSDENLLLFVVRKKRLAALGRNLGDHLCRSKHRSSLRRLGGPFFLPRYDKTDF